jgi:protein-L-isoaspartate(D-aspartate) O-methyltransferase
MVDEQLRGRGIVDGRVLAAMSEVPRDRFLPPHLQGAAYHDGALPIAEGQTMSQPWIVAFMAQELRLSGDELVLEVGAGSGYAAAVLARLAAAVVSVERHAGLAARARDVLAELDVPNVEVRTGDGSLGVPDRAPFDAVSVTAAAPRVPDALVDQLADGGRLVLPLAHGAREVLTRVVRRGEETVMEPLVECRFVPLVGEAGYADDR